VRVKNREISRSYLSPSPSSPPTRGGEILLFTGSSILEVRKEGNSPPWPNGLDSLNYSIVKEIAF
jgi:hypothetical protein